jgi:phospholipid/cholesterol/gamma-HCH transport system substrate-binding protein
MEIRARYALMGAFTLTVLVAAFAFVYWLNHAGGFQERALYEVRFEGPVSGLLRGSAVLFNGIRVGEVAGLELNPESPRQVLVTIAVDRPTPIRADTAVGIDFQGLTGSPVVALVGGSSSQPLASKARYPLLVAGPAAGQGMSQAARDVLRRIDGVLAENAQPLRTMIANLDTFAQALARNSDHLDGIVAGLERMTAGAAAHARAIVYDLTVPVVPAGPDRMLAVQVVIAEPTALGVLDTEKIQSTSVGGVTSALPDAQWSDTLPKLVQMKLIRGFEDANLFAAVNRPLDGLSADVQVLIDIRKFQMISSPVASAEVEFAAKVLDNSGHIIATHVLAAAVPVESDGTTAAVAALDKAFGKAAADLMPWAVHTIAARSDRLDVPKAAARKRVTKE